MYNLAGWLCRWTCTSRHFLSPHTREALWGTQPRWCWLPHGSFCLFRWGTLHLPLRSAAACLTCILQNWDSFDAQTLKKKCLIFCTQAWPQHKLVDGEARPSEGSINYNTILQLDLFCRREGRWSEVPCVQACFALRDNQELGQQCKIDPLLQAMLTQSRTRESESPKEVMGPSAPPGACDPGIRGQRTMDPFLAPKFKPNRPPSIGPPPPLPPNPPHTHLCAGETAGSDCRKRAH